MHLDKTCKGNRLLLFGWALAITRIGGLNSLFIILGIVIFVYWNWQAHDVNRLAKYYQEYIIQYAGARGNFDQADIEEMSNNYLILDWIQT